MKKIISLISVLFYLVSVFQIAIPYISYKLNYHHIVNELCISNFVPGHEDCDGHCVLKKHINDDHSDHGEKQSEASLSNFTYLIYLKPDVHYPEAPRNYKDIPRGFHLLNEYSCYLSVHLPPPKA